MKTVWKVYIQDNEIEGVVVKYGKNKHFLSMGGKMTLRQLVDLYLKPKEKEEK